MRFLKKIYKRSKLRFAKITSKYTADDQGVVRTVGENDPSEAMQSGNSDPQRNSKLFVMTTGLILFIVIVGLIGVVVAVTATEHCIDNWTSWSGFDSCSDRGVGPYKKRRQRSKFDSAVCARANHSVQYEYDYQECDYNGFWGTGHYCGQELANMILHSQNGCNRHDPAKAFPGWQELSKSIQDINNGACGLLEEANEDASGKTINREAAGTGKAVRCEVYTECCENECYPNELGIEEC